MENIAFTDKKTIPTEESLKIALSDVHPSYLDLMNTCSAFDTKWTFYKGWMLKVFDKKKALFYVIPLDNAMQVNLTIRQKEKEAFLEDSDLEYLHEAISESEKFSEGFALRFTVENMDSYNKLKTFILKLITHRK